MPKLAWNAFVTKYPGAGHLVSTGTQPRLFRMPPGISPHNQKRWPSIPALLKESVGAGFGDWAHTSRKVPGSVTRNGRQVRVAAATLHLFVFARPADASTAGKFLKASSLAPVASPQAGFASLIRGSEIDTREYGLMVKALGY